MKGIRILLITLLFTVGVFGQQTSTIEGSVTTVSGQSGRNAIVILVSETGAQIGRVNANEQGSFVFSNIADGRYELIANVGRLSAKQIVNVAGGDALNIQLIAGQNISEIVTVSADSPQSLDEVSKTVNVISGQEMRERADFSLIESLRSIPGFRIQQLGGFGRMASVKTRGLRNHDTAILIDGIRFRDAAAINGDASSFLSDITLTSVSRVEVLRGTGTAVHGTNAIGGAVNFITPQAREGWHGQVSGAFGGLGLGRFRGNTSYGSANGKFGFNIGGAYTAYTKGIDGDDDAFNTNIQPRFDFRPTDRTAFSARFFYSDASVKLNSSPDTLGVMPPTNATIIDAKQGVNFIYDVNDPDNKQKSRFLSSVFTFTHAFTNDLSLNAHYSGLKTRRINDNGLLGVGWQSESRSYNDGLIQTVNANLLWTPKHHTVRFGYEFEHEKYGNNGFTPSGTDDNFTRAYQSSNTFFINDVVSLDKGRLQLMGGMRAQWFDLKTPKFSDNVAYYNNVTAVDPPAAYTFDGAASYYFRTGTKLRAHVGTGYRVPSLYERFGSYHTTWPAPGFVVLGGPDLKPERSKAFDAAVEQNLHNGKTRLTATYFYTDLTDIIGYGAITNDPFNRLNGYLNTIGGIARGGEFSATFKPTSSTDIFTSYTLTKSLQREPQVGGSGILQSLAIPEHQFTMVATQRYKRFWVNADLLINSNYLGTIFSNTTFSSYVYRFDGNKRVDLTGGYTFKLNNEKYDLRVFGTIENLFDNEYYDNGFRTAGINGRIGLSFGF